MEAQSGWPVAALVVGLLPEGPGALQCIAGRGPIPRAAGLHDRVDGGGVGGPATVHVEGGAVLMGGEGLEPGFAGGKCGALHCLGAQHRADLCVPGGIELVALAGFFDGVARECGRVLEAFVGESVLRQVVAGACLRGPTAGTDRMSHHGIVDQRPFAAPARFPLHASFPLPPVWPTAAA